MSYSEFPAFLRVFSLSLVISMVVVRVGIFVATRWGFISRPNPICPHSGGSVALGGGISVGISLMITLLLCDSLVDIRYRLLLGLVPVLIVGSLDDLVALRPLPKLLLQCAAVLPYLAMGPCGGWSLPMAGLFLVACQNAWNLLDIMDGLVGWTTTICLVGCCGVLALTTGSSAGAALAALVGAGSVSGFLVWNVHPAKVYLGDAGSLSLGMLFGLLALEGFDAGHRGVIPILVTGLIPFFELQFLIVERTRKGIPFYRGSPDHFALRLLREGHTVPAVIQRVRIVSVCLTIIAWGLACTGVDLRVIALILPVLLLGGFVAHCYLRTLPRAERGWS